MEEMELEDNAVGGDENQVQEENAVGGPPPLPQQNHDADYISDEEESDEYEEPEVSITKEILGKHIDGYTEETAYVLADSITRTIKRISETQKKLSSFIQALRRKIKFLHIYCLKVEKDCGKYPLDTEVESLLKYFITVECSAFFSISKDERDGCERKIARRLWKTLRQFIRRGSFRAKYSQNENRKHFLKLMLRCYAQARRICSENSIIAYGVDRSMALIGVEERAEEFKDYSIDRFDLSSSETRSGSSFHHLIPPSYNLLHSDEDSEDDNLLENEMVKRIFARKQASNPNQTPNISEEQKDESESVHIVEDLSMQILEELEITNEEDTKEDNEKTLNDEEKEIIIDSNEGENAFLESTRELHNADEKACCSKNTLEKTTRVLKHSNEVPDKSRLNSVKDNSNESETIDVDDMKNKQQNIRFNNEKDKEMQARKSSLMESKTESRKINPDSKGSPSEKDFEITSGILKQRNNVADESGSGIDKYNSNGLGTIQADIKNKEQKKKNNKEGTEEMQTNQTIVKKHTNCNQSLNLSAEQEDDLVCLIDTVEESTIQILEESEKSKDETKREHTKTSNNREKEIVDSSEGESGKNIFLESTTQSQNVNADGKGGSSKKDLEKNPRVLKHSDEAADISGLNGDKLNSNKSGTIEVAEQNLNLTNCNKTINVSKPNDSVISVQILDGSPMQIPEESENSNGGDEKNENEKTSNDIEKEIIVDSDEREYKKNVFLESTTKLLNVDTVEKDCSSVNGLEKTPGVSKHSKDVPDKSKLDSVNDNSNEYETIEVFEMKNDISKNKSNIERNEKMHTEPTNAVQHTNLTNCNQTPPLSDEQDDDLICLVQTVEDSPMQISEESEHVIDETKRDNKNTLNETDKEMITNAVEGGELRKNAESTQKINADEIGCSSEKNLEKTFRPLKRVRKVANMFRLCDDRYNNNMPGINKLDSYKQKFIDENKTLNQKTENFRGSDKIRVNMINNVIIIDSDEEDMMDIEKYIREVNRKNPLLECTTELQKINPDCKDSSSQKDFKITSGILKHRNNVADGSGLGIDHYNSNKSGLIQADLKNKEQKKKYNSEEETDGMQTNQTPNVSEKREDDSVYLFHTVENSPMQISEESEKRNNETKNTLNDTEKGIIANSGEGESRKNLLLESVTDSQKLGADEKGYCSRNNLGKTSVDLNHSNEAADKFGSVVNKDQSNKSGTSKLYSYKQNFINANKTLRENNLKVREGNQVNDIVIIIESDEEDNGVSDIMDKEKYRQVALLGNTKESRKVNTDDKDSSLKKDLENTSVVLKYSNDVPHEFGLDSDKIKSHKSGTINVYNKSQKQKINGEESEEMHTERNIIVQHINLTNCNQTLNVSEELVAESESVQTMKDSSQILEETEISREDTTVLENSVEGEIRKTALLESTTESQNVDDDGKGGSSKKNLEIPPEILKHSKAGNKSPLVGDKYNNDEAGTSKLDSCKQDSANKNKTSERNEKIMTVYLKESGEIQVNSADNVIIIESDDEDLEEYLLRKRLERRNKKKSKKRKIINEVPYIVSDSSDSEQSEQTEDELKVDIAKIFIKFGIIWQSTTSINDISRLIDLVTDFNVESNFVDQIDEAENSSTSTIDTLDNNTSTIDTSDNSSTSTIDTLDNNSTSTIDTLDNNSTSTIETLVNDSTITTETLDNIDTITTDTLDINSTRPTFDLSLHTDQANELDQGLNLDPPSNENSNSDSFLTVLPPTLLDLFSFALTNRNKLDELLDRFLASGRPETQVDHSQIQYQNPSPEQSHEDIVDPWRQDESRPENHHEILVENTTAEISMSENVEDPNPNQSSDRVSSRASDQTEDDELEEMQARIDEVVENIKEVSKIHTYFKYFKPQRETVRQEIIQPIDTPSTLGSAEEQNQFAIDAMLELVNRNSEKRKREEDSINGSNSEEEQILETKNATITKDTAVRNIECNNEIGAAATLDMENHGNSEDCETDMIYDESNMDSLWQRSNRRTPVIPPKRKTFLKSKPIGVPSTSGRSGNQSKQVEETNSFQDFEPFHSSVPKRPKY